MKKCILWLCLISVVSILSAQGLQFYREDLVFTVEPGYFQVEGDYYFRNTSDREIRQILLYPFPENPLLGKVDTITVHRLADQTNCLVRVHSRQAYFAVDIAPQDSSCYHIMYRQNLLAHQAEYILLTTQHWQRPFEQAHYQIMAPVEMILDSLSYQPDRSRTENGMQIHEIHREHFMPDRNMIIEFH